MVGHLRLHSLAFQLLPPQQLSYLATMDIVNTHHQIQYSNDTYSGLKVHYPCPALMRDNDYMVSTIIMLEYRPATSVSVCTGAHNPKGRSVQLVYVC